MAILSPKTTKFIPDANMGTGNGGNSIYQNKLTVEEATYSESLTIAAHSSETIILDYDIEDKEIFEYLPVYAGNNSCVITNIGIDEELELLTATIFNSSTNSVTIAADTIKIHVLIQETEATIEQNVISETYVTTEINTNNFQVVTIPDITVYDNQNSASITPSNLPLGYTFLCWIEATTHNFLGGPYITDPTSDSTTVWWSHAGNGTITASYLCYYSTNVTALSRLADLLYPVGSIYISTNSTDPALLFGGSWNRIEDCFLLGAGSSFTAGSTGGEIEHTLTTDEIPEHAHSTPGWVVYDAGNSGTNRNAPATQSGNTPLMNAPLTMTSTGGDQSHNNMPPYLTVYMWERVS